MLLTDYAEAITRKFYCEVLVNEVSKIVRIFLVRENYIIKRYSVFARGRDLVRPDLCVHPMIPFYRRFDLSFVAFPVITEI